MSQHDGSPGGTRVSGLTRWLAGRTLRGRLIAGLVALLAVACAVVGIVTYLVTQSTLVNQMDGQLAAAGGRYAQCMESNDDIEQAQEEGGPPPAGQHGAPAAIQDCSRIPGQSSGTFGARIKNGVVTAQGVALGESHLSAADKATLASLPPDHRFYTMDLASLHGDYRLTAGVA